MSHRIVVVEDDPSIGQAIEAALRAHGHQVRWCRSATAGVAAVEDLGPDLVLVDVGLPDSDGFTLCRWLRDRDRDVAIILVTARDDDIDVVVGLDAGADDYVTKPFSMNVLLARVRSHLRGRDGADPPDRIVVGELEVDADGWLVTAAGQPVDLRPREFELLVALARSVGRVVTRHRLLADVWGITWDDSSRTLDMHVSALRRKLGAHVEIATVRGVGYRLSPP